MEGAMTLDLLRERLIQTDAGWHSLPGLLAAMAQGAVALLHKSPEGIHVVNPA
jgi:hypothetical protein